MSIFHYQKRYKSTCISKGTSGKWIKWVLSGAGIDMNIFTLIASTSNMSKTSSKIQLVVKRNFYDRNITNNSDFAQSVLDKSKLTLILKFVERKMFVR